MEWIEGLQQRLGSQLLGLVHHNWLLLAVITLAVLAWYFAASHGAVVSDTDSDASEIDGDD